MARFPKKFLEEIYTKLLGKFTTVLLKDFPKELFPEISKGTLEGIYERTIVGNAGGIFEIPGGTA